MRIAMIGTRGAPARYGGFETAVEEIGFGHAADAAVIERLANRAEQVVVLHEADRMFPRR